MEPLIQGVLTAAGKGPRELTRWLDDHANELTLELAAAAREAFTQAVAARNAGAAASAALAATFVFLRLGEMRDALANYLDYHQLRFMFADDVDAYQAVYLDSHGLIARAEDIEANDLAFRAATLAADAAFFAAKVEADPAKREDWLLASLTDLIAASGHGKHHTDPSWFMRYVSLLSATLSETASVLWMDDKSVAMKQRLRRLAAATEGLIPVDFEFVDSAPKTNTVARTLADLSYKHGNPGVADGRLSLAILRAQQASDIETWMQTVFDRYVGARDSGSPEPRLAELRQTLRSQADRLRARFRSRAGRLWVAQELDRIFGVLLMDEAKGEHADAADVFKAAEMTKARTLLDQMRRDTRDFPDTALAAQATDMERQMLRFSPEDPEMRDLASSEMRLSSLLPIGTYWDAAERGQMLGAIEAFYATHRAGFEEVAAISGLSQVMNALHPGEVLIEYCIPHHPLHPTMELWIIAVTSQKAYTIPVPLEGMLSCGMIGRMSIDGRQPLDISPFGEVVVELRMAIQGSDDERACTYLEALWQLLIGPVVALGLRPQDFQRWIIVPHGILHHVPFAALRDAHGRYLVEDVALTTVPSGSVWFGLQGRSMPPARSFLGFCNPDLDYCEAPSLESAETELKKVLRILEGVPCEVLRREKATEAALRAQVADKSIIHFATHGEFPEEDAIDFHRILLAATAEHDGRVHAEELRRMDLQAARLVVLSICNGGLYRFGPGDEPYGLIPALLTAGVENVLGTLWPLEDQIGRVFMVDFYKRLIQDGPAEAVRQACGKFIQDKALLRHWAGFVLVGPGRSLS